MVVTLFSANKRFASLNRVGKWAVKRLRSRGMTEAMQHEPSGLLRDRYVLGQLSAGDTLIVRGDQPDRHKPLLQADFAVLENCANLDGEALFAITTFVRRAIRKVIIFLELQ